MATAAIAKAFWPKFFPRLKGAIGVTGIGEVVDDIDDVSTSLNMTCRAPAVLQGSIEDEDTRGSS